MDSDMWGPSQVETIGGRKYFVTLTNDATRHTHAYLMVKKSETFAKYKEYEAWAKTHHNAVIKLFHSDCGGESLSAAFISHLKRAGTLQILTIHDTPEQNGTAERLNGILLEKVRAMLHASGLPKFLWGEAIRHAVWLKN